MPPAETPTCWKNAWADSDSLGGQLGRNAGFDSLTLWGGAGGSWATGSRPRSVLVRTVGWRVVCRERICTKSGSVHQAGGRAASVETSGGLPCGIGATGSGLASCHLSARPTCRLKPNTSNSIRVTATLARREARVKSMAKPAASDKTQGDHRPAPGGRGQVLPVATCPQCSAPGLRWPRRPCLSPRGGGVTGLGSGDGVSRLPAKRVT